jgi:SAM-dependent methyltransferase
MNTDRAAAARPSGGSDHEDTSSSSPRHPAGTELGDALADQPGAPVDRAPNAPARADFDEFAPEYVDAVDKSVAFTGRDSAFFAERKVDLLERLAASRVGGLAASSLLDVGCGTGTADKLLVDRCGQLAGVDVSEEMLVEARRTVPGVDYRWYDGFSLPFEGGRFDVVLAICVLHHVEPPDRPAFVAELARVTRPGGLLAIFEHNPFNPLTRRAVSTCPVDEGVVLSRHTQTLALLRQAGIDDANVTHYLFSPLGGGLGRGIDAVFSWLPMGGQYVAWGSPRRDAKLAASMIAHPGGKQAAGSAEAQTS